MALKSALLFLLLLPTGCQLIPGGGNEIHYFETQQRGIATLARVYQRNDKTLLDFSWQARNHLADRETYQQVDVQKIAGLPANFDFQVGAKIPLSVVHVFKQRGSSTPKRLRSEWFFGAENVPGNPALWNYRPPRCINQ